MDYQRVLPTKKCGCRSCDQMIPAGRKRYCDDNCRRREVWLRKLMRDKDKPVSGWGSKNSQIRLDKASRRNAKRMRGGNTARYY